MKGHTIFFLRLYVLPIFPCHIFFIAKIDVFTKKLLEYISVVIQIHQFLIILILTLFEKSDQGLLLWRSFVAILTLGITIR